MEKVHEFLYRDLSKPGDPNSLQKWGSQAQDQDKSIWHFIYIYFIYIFSSEHTPYSQHFFLQPVVWEV